MPNNYEIHIGFPTDDNHSAIKVLEHLQSKQRGWVYSEVFNVDSNPDLLDPHNVPGTLGCLLSKDYAANDLRAVDKVLADLQYVLTALSKMEVRNARVELEFVFGYSHHKKKGDYLLELYTWPTPILGSEQLVFIDGERIPETPNSEIHFVLEPFKPTSDDANAKDMGLHTDLTTAEAAEIVGSFGVHVEQTIEYVSQAMRAANVKRRKFICTSYFESPEGAEESARKLIDNQLLLKRLADRGYVVKLVLERIFACFKPTEIQKHVNLPIAGSTGVENIFFS